MSIIETYSKKQQAIFNTGKALFWKYGIKKVTIEEICQEAQISKMTFYKFYPNKMALAQSILQIIMDDSLSLYRDIVNGDLLFQEKIKMLFELKIKSSNDISLEFINDIYKNTDSELFQILEKSGQESLSIFIDFFHDSQNKGLIRKDIKVEFILFQMGQMKQLFDNQDLVSVYDSPQDLIMESMNYMFYGLLP